LIREIEMLRWVGICTATLVALSLYFSPGSAQEVFLGAGGSLPTGDFGVYADVGWVVGGGLGLPLNDKGLSIFADARFGSNKYSDIDGDKAVLLAGFVGIEMSFSGSGGVGPFVFGKAGVLRHDDRSRDFPQYEVDGTGAAFGGGAGYRLPLKGSLNAWVLGEYIQGQFDDEDGNTTFLALMAGVSIPLGGK
jgi:hypothetical protein